MCGTVWRNWQRSPKVCLTTNSPNTFHTGCLGQVGRIKIRIFGAAQRLPTFTCKSKGLKKPTSCKASAQMHQGNLGGSRDVRLQSAGNAGLIWALPAIK